MQLVLQPALPDLPHPLPRAPLSPHLLPFTAQPAPTLVIGSIRARTAANSVHDPIQYLGPLVLISQARCTRFIHHLNFLFLGADSPTPFSVYVARIQT